MIQKAFRDDAVSAAQIKMSHKHFKVVKNLLKVIMFQKACNKRNT